MTQFKDSIKGKNVAVFGLGASGNAAARVLASLDARVTVVDNNDSEKLRALAKELQQLGVTCKLGEVTEEAMRASELVVVSPGVPSDRSELEVARRAGARHLST